MIILKYHKEPRPPPLPHTRRIKLILYQVASLSETESRKKNILRQAEFPLKLNRAIDIIDR